MPRRPSSARRSGTQPVSALGERDRLRPCSPACPSGCAAHETFWGDASRPARRAVSCLRAAPESARAFADRSLDLARWRTSRVPQQALDLPLPNRATCSGSKFANAARKASRLRKIVSQESPDWNPRASRSSRPGSSTTGRPLLVVIRVIRRVAGRPASLDSGNLTLIIPLSTRTGKGPDRVDSRERECAPRADSMFAPWRGQMATPSSQSKSPSASGPSCGNSGPRSRSTHRPGCRRRRRAPRVQDLDGARWQLLDRADVELGHRYVTRGPKRRRPILGQRVPFALCSASLSVTAPAART